MKRIWFVQQQPFDFMPLKVGLGMITEKELQEYPIDWALKKKDNMPILCPKIYTTRTRPMAGEYQVVRGSRFKAVPLDPPIEFKVESNVQFDLKSLTVPMPENNFLYPNGLSKSYTIPELDLGVVGTTVEMLRDELLRSYKKATIDTPFYINKLELLDD